MLALASTWLGLMTLILATAMCLHRPTMTDLTVTLVLYFGSPGALCLAGLVLWAYRKEGIAEPGIEAQRMQARVAIGLSLIAAAMVYWLIIGARQIEPIEPTADSLYNAPLEEEAAIAHAWGHDAGNTERPG